MENKLWYGLEMRATSLRSYPSKLIHIGFSDILTHGIQEAPERSHQIDWKSFESFFFMMYNAWKDVDITVLEGNYSFRKEELLRGR